MPSGNERTNEGRPPPPGRPSRRLFQRLRAQHCNGAPLAEDDPAPRSPNSAASIAAAVLAESPDSPAVLGGGPVVASPVRINWAPSAPAGAAPTTIPSSEAPQAEPAKCPLPNVASPP